jgi:monolysocardiolipin acyltransferase
MAAEERPYEPPALTRAIHNVTMGTVGFICRSFLYGLSRTEVHGLEHFQALVDERSDPRSRERGLITGRWLSCCSIVLVYCG